MCSSMGKLFLALTVEKLYVEFHLSIHPDDPGQWEPQGSRSIPTSCGTQKE